MLQCSVENLELGEGVSDGMALELEAGEPRIPADKSPYFEFV